MHDRSITKTAGEQKYNFFVLQLDYRAATSFNHFKDKKIVALSRPRKEMLSNVIFYFRKTRGSVGDIWKKMIIILRLLNDKKGLRIGMFLLYV